MISTILLFLFFSGAITSCNSMHSEVISNNIESSIAGKILLIGGLSMDIGPQDLLVMDTLLFAKIDDKIYKISISKLDEPKMIDSFIDNKTTASFFGRMINYNNQLFIPNHNGNLYTLRTDLENTKLLDQTIIHHSLQIPNFKAHSIVVDKEGVFWIGGSNTNDAILAKYILSDNKLHLKNSWTGINTKTNLESLVEKNDYIIASSANGNLLVFSKQDISTGPISFSSSENSNGIEKSGYSLLLIGDLVYWANWEAGLASFNFKNPLKPVEANIITNKDFKSKFPFSEGTSVYDMVYNAKKNYICVANGWQGVFILDPKHPQEVLDYIDPKFFQNRCIATKDEYLYVGNISSGINGDLKGIKVFKLN